MVEQAAKPAILISVYRPQTLAQTLNAAKCSPSGPQRDL